MIYFLQPTDGGPIKIGYSADVEARHRQLEAHYGQPLAILATIEGDRQTERELHQRFAHLRLGRTEQFKPGPDLMEFIGRPLLVGANPDAVEAIEAIEDRPCVETFNRKPLIANFRGSAEFKQWLQDLAGHDRETVAGVIERALVHYAKTIGFGEEAPER